MNMFGFVKTGLLLLISFGILAEPKDERADDGGFMKAFGLEKKYYLKDCMAKLDFIWNPDIDQSTKRSVFDEIEDPITKAIMSGEFPYFSGHTTREKKYYVFYFMDRCENRLEYVRKLVEEKFLPDIPDFPRYEIKHEGIEPGFDGVTPSCCWLDD